MLAILAGIKPPIIVKITLRITKTNPATNGTDVVIITPVNAKIILFIGNVRSTVMPIPITPAISPTIKVSALKTLDISFFDAPIALKIPISFVLSSTEIYVIHN